MEFTFDTTRAIFNLVFNGTMERYPRIKWVVAHAGGTVPSSSIDLACFGSPTRNSSLRRPAGRLRTTLAQLYYDTALSASKNAFASHAATVGDDHILLAATSPLHRNWRRRVSVIAIDGLMGEMLSSDTQHCIRRGSALHYFPHGRSPRVL